MKHKFLKKKCHYKFTNSTQGRQIQHKPKPKNDRNILETEIPLKPKNE